jgi:hypothetical protein
VGCFEVDIVGVVLSAGVTGYLLSKARVCHYQVPGGSLRSAVFSREEAHDERPLDTANMPVCFEYTTSDKVFYSYSTMRAFLLLFRGVVITIAEKIGWEA